MADAYEPVVARRRLKTELKNARKAAQRTQREVASAMDWSTAKLIRIESGEAKISRNDLKALLEYYGIVELGRIDALHQMARTVREEQSWSDFRETFSGAARRFLGFESTAETIRGYQPIVVPGLLQTEEYCAALLRDMMEYTPDTIELAWQVRQRRHRLHDRTQPPLMYFVIDEAVIRRPVGGWRVMKRQLLALRDYADQPHVTIQILPFSVGAHPGLNARFVLLEFSDPGDDDVLYLEEPDNATRDDPEETGSYLDRFFKLMDIAIPPEDTVEFLDQVIAEMDKTFQASTD